MVEAAHTADTNDNASISLNELIRVVQFFNADGIHCETGTEDGYALGPGAETCTPHNVDYAPQDWIINLSEILRIIQIYNIGTYFECPGTEDGICLGPLTSSGNLKFIPSSEIGSISGQGVAFGLFDSATGSLRVYFTDGSSTLFTFQAG
jgi:hypothetical protein